MKSKVTKNITYLEAKKYLKVNLQIYISLKLFTLCLPNQNQNQQVLNFQKVISLSIRLRKSLHHQLNQTLPQYLCLSKSSQSQSNSRHRSGSARSHSQSGSQSSSQSCSQSHSHLVRSLVLSGSRKKNHRSSTGQSSSRRSNSGRGSSSDRQAKGSNDPIKMANNYGILDCMQTNKEMYILLLTSFSLLFI